MRIRRFLTFGIAVLVISYFPMSVGVLPATAYNSNDGAKALYQNVQNESDQVRERITKFLTAWFTEQNTKHAMGFFSKEAFKNQAMLSESCAGYISPEQRQSESAIKSGVGEFLNDFITGPKGRSLSQVLNEQRISGKGGKGVELVNNIANDRYALYKIDRSHMPELLEDQARSEYLQSHLPAGDWYVSLIAIYDGFFYLIWVKEDGRWRIFHVSLVCS